MRIVHKLFLATLLPALLIWTVGIYATRMGEESLRASIESALLGRARATMDEIDRIVQARAANWEAYCRSELVASSLSDSNREYEKFDDLEQTISERDQEWQATPKEEISPLMRRLARNTLSRDLRILLRKLKESSGYRVYGEVFVTNKYGANIAQTNRTSDYRQDDEQWWQRAVADGLYITDVAFDESAAIHSIGICLRVDNENDEFIGVVKAVMNIRDVFSVIDSRAKQSRPGEHLVLLTNDGRIIRSVDGNDAPLADASRILKGVQLDHANQGRSMSRVDPETDEKLLSAFAISRGYGNFHGLGWIVVDESREAEVFAPVNRLRREIVWLSSVATLLSLLIGGTIAWSLSRRLGRLTDASDAIGRGEFSTEVKISGRDEIGRLAKHFNQMRTDLQLANDDLVEARDEAQDANRAKSMFLANMSHEIRTPMNGVIGMSELLDQSNLDEDQRDKLSMIKYSADALLRLLNDILDFSKIEAGKLEFEEIEFDLRECVRQSTQLLEGQAAAKDLVLRSTVEPGIPEMVIGDPGRLRQVLLNLVGNAIKFTERGEVAVEVTSTSITDSQLHLSFQVRDTGIGIPADKLDAVFDVFQQVDASTSRQFGGTGLGLAITKQLVVLMGGEIWLESMVDQGTTFFFTAAFGLSKTSDEVDSKEADEPSNESEPMRILLAEDGIVNQKVATGLLQMRGHQVIVAENGAAAVKAFNQDKFDLILMDIQMPEMDGYEATAAIRELERESGSRIPIVAMTANALTGDRERCLDAGMDAYVAKPIKPEELDSLLVSLDRKCEEDPEPRP